MAQDKSRSHKSQKPKNKTSTKKSTISSDRPYQLSAEIVVESDDDAPPENGTLLKPTNGTASGSQATNAVAQIAHAAGPAPKTPTKKAKPARAHTSTEKPARRNEAADNGLAHVVRPNKVARDSTNQLPEPQHKASYESKSTVQHRSRDKASSKAHRTARDSIQPDGDLSASSSSESSASQGESATEESDSEISLSLMGKEASDQTSLSRQQATQSKDRPRLSFSAPSGFVRMDSQPNSQSETELNLTSQNLQDKDLWLFSFPSDLPLSAIGAVSHRTLLDGGSAFSHQGTQYGFSQAQNDHNVAQNCIFAASHANPSLFETHPTATTRHFRLQQVLKPPIALDSRPDRAHSTPGDSGDRISTNAPVQPSGLRMRYRAFGTNEASSSDEGTTKPTRSSDPVPVNLITSQEILPNAADASAASPQQRKKKRRKHDVEKSQEDVAVNPRKAVEGNRDAHPGDEVAPRIDESSTIVTKKHRDKKAKADRPTSSATAVKSQSPSEPVLKSPQHHRKEHKRKKPLDMAGEESGRPAKRQAQNTTSMIVGQEQTPQKDRVMTNGVMSDVHKGLGDKGITEAEHSAALRKAARKAKRREEKAAARQRAVKE